MIYINEKPFVLREESSPFQNIKTYTGISAERLEAMELRLKQDIIREAAKHQGLILVHEEKGMIMNYVIVICMIDYDLSIDDGRVVPVWSSASNIATPAEAFHHHAAFLGYRVTYHRIPISPAQSFVDRGYIDRYVAAMRDVPIGQRVVFNCGMGVARSTFAQIVVCVIVAVCMQRFSRLE